MEVIEPSRSRSSVTLSASVSKRTGTSNSKPAVMAAPAPGAALKMEPVKMDFHYSTSFGKASPEAYERLLLDAMAGDATLFARRDEVENAWKFIDDIEQAWHGDNPPPMAEYPAGSWGPPEADELLARTGRVWRRL